MKKTLLLGCLPLLFVPLLLLVLFSVLLGGSSSVSVSANAPAGVSQSQLAVAQAIVKRIKQEVPNATPNGLAALLGCFQAESGLDSKRAEGDYLPYPVGAGLAPDALTYDKVSWLDLGGAAIYGAGSPEASTIEERGLGLGQFTNSRNLALQAFAQKAKQKWYDLGTQLDYILTADGDAAALKAIVAESGDVTKTTTDFVNQYERGGSRGLAERIAFAQAWANYLTNPVSSGASSKGGIASLNALIGEKAGDGQCYALVSWYAKKISGIQLVGLNAYAIGSDNAAAFQAAHWQVIANPTASDLQAGAIVCWQEGVVANEPFGHTGVINSVKGSTFTTYEQNVNGNETVELYSRTWDSSMTFVLVPPAS